MKKSIGIDLGGTKILGGIINENGEIIEKYEMATGGNLGKEEVLSRIGQVIGKLITEEIIGIGIASPGFIDTKEGKVLEVGGNIKVAPQVSTCKKKSWKITKKAYFR